MEQVKLENGLASVKAEQIRSIVFDLDGTLYVNRAIGGEIEQTACNLIANSRGVPSDEGWDLLDRARKQLSELNDVTPTLTRTCMELGIEAREFHQALEQQVHPENYLSPDPLLRSLLVPLTQFSELYVYTNNNYPLSLKILSLLGVEDLFKHLYTIEFCWQPKPDIDALQRVMADIGGSLESFLFVGDREQVDLVGPAEFGSNTLLVREVSDLLLIHKLLNVSGS
jgi:putative hydrolase of the HAD superfamily